MEQYIFDELIYLTKQITLELKVESLRSLDML